jgi:hypothetical protein
MMLATFAHRFRFLNANPATIDGMIMIENITVKKSIINTMNPAGGGFGSDLSIAYMNPIIRNMNNTLKPA